MTPLDQYLVLSLADVPDWVERTLALALLLAPAVRALERPTRPPDEPFLRPGRLLRIAAALGAALLAAFWVLRGGS